MKIYNMKELVYDINEKALSDVTYVGFYDDVVELLEELIKFGYSITFVEIEPATFDGYDKEYCLSILGGEIYVEKAMRKSGYITEESDVIYINDQCNSVILKKCFGKIIEVEIADGEEESGCETCPERFECSDYLSEQDDDKDVRVHVNNDGEIHKISIDKHGEDGCIHFEYESTKSVDDDFLDTVLSYF